MGRTLTCHTNVEIGEILEPYALNLVAAVDDWISKGLCFSIFFLTI